MVQVNSFLAPSVDGETIPQAPVGKTPETRYGVATQGVGMRWFFTCGVILAAVYLELTYAPWTLPRLVGHKTEAALDLWSFEHATGGFIIGRCLGHWRRYHLFTDLAWLLLALAFGWEVCECLMEVHGTAHMQTWLAGTEHWSNRLVTDPLLFTLGAFYGRWTPGKPWVSSAIYLTWYLANLMQPSCMSLQQWFMSLK